MRKGFTFLELIVVMTIMSILTLLSTPSFINYIKGSQLKSAAREICSQFRTARQYAITTGENYWVVINNAEDTYGSETIGYALKIYKSDEGSVTKWNYLPKFVNIDSTNFGNPPGGVQIPWPYDSSPQSEWKVLPTAVFYPTGASSSGTVIIRKESSDKGKKVTVTPVTGRVQISDQAF